MVIAQLQGSLGRQLFQYAFGRALASQKGVPFKLDPILGFRNDTAQSKYALHPFQIQENFASEEELRVIMEQADVLEESGISLAGENPILRGDPTREFQYDPEILTTPDQVYVEGCWKNEKYFASVAPMLRREFTVQPQWRSANNKYWEQRIKGALSVALCCLKPEAGESGAAPLLDYYRESIRIICERVPRAELFVFCEDPQWARANIQATVPVSFVSGNASDNAFEALRLMALCRHQIITIDDLSWWAAWLGERPGQMVLAPQQLGRVSEADANNLFPARWLRIFAKTENSDPAVVPQTGAILRVPEPMEGG
jgi:hypothetical protein